MRKLAVFSWLLLPIFAGAYHYGPGQDQLKLDEVARVLRVADQAAASEHWDTAVALYDEALVALPADRIKEVRRIRLERAKAEMLNQQLPEANADLKGLIEELQADKSTDPKFLAEARESLGTSQYYMTWLMKLEGLGRADWEPEIESSRQAYRLLAEEADKAGDTASSQKYSEDLESAIRLARMEPGELQGKAIPKQCKNCKSGQCKKPGRNPNKSQNKPKDSRGASQGPEPDGSGS